MTALIKSDVKNSCLFLFLMFANQIKNIATRMFALVREKLVKT